MKMSISVKQPDRLSETDYLAWRVAKVRKRESEESHKRAYNERPRLRNVFHQ